jgi:tetratricopeptide (TPR) repeat protein
MKKDPAFDILFFERVLSKQKNYIEVIELLGGLYTQQGRIDDGLKMDLKLTQLLPDSPEAHYNLACSLSLKKHTKNALEALEKAIHLGYDDFEWMENDPDLSFLKAQPAFKNLLQKHKQTKSTAD